jgi:hypothetical protein
MKKKGRQSSGLSFGEKTGTVQQNRSQNQQSKLRAGFFDLAQKAAMPARRFPPPWSVAEYNDACFIVRDHDGQALSYRLRICLLLTFGRDGALGTSHEPSVGRYTGYGSGLLYGELERLWHAQQDGTSLIACLSDLAKHLIEVQRLAFCPSKSFLALQRDHTAIMDAKLPDKVRLGIETSIGAVIAY